MEVPPKSSLSIRISQPRVSLQLVEFPLNATHNIGKVPAKSFNCGNQLVIRHTWIYSIPRVVEYAVSCFMIS